MNSAFNYAITNPHQFERDSFCDVSSFKQYLNNIGVVESDSDSNFKFVFSMVESFASLRFLAEEKQKKARYSAKDKRRELPLSWFEIDALLSVNGSDSPPQTTISKIAQVDFYILEKVFSGIRKILKRERESVHLAKVQQLDSKCLTWLTRQPGITPIQKAGSRQTLMAIVRKESYNTLENRVLKSLFKLCVNHSILYIKKYSHKYHNSERIQAVKNLIAFAQKALKSSVFDSVETMTSIPMPNYVLRYDPYYSRVWQMYIDLLKYNRLLESAWRYRHKLLGDYIKLNVGVCFDQNIGKSIFASNIWFLYEIKNSSFMVGANLQKIVDCNGIIVEYNEVTPSEFDTSFYVKIGNRKILFSIIFIPAEQDSLITFQQIDNHFYITYNESKVKIEKRDDILPIVNLDDIIPTIGCLLLDKMQEQEL